MRNDGICFVWSECRLMEFLRYVFFVCCEVIGWFLYVVFKLRGDFW